MPWEAWFLLALSAFGVGAQVWRMTNPEEYLRTVQKQTPPSFGGAMINFGLSAIYIVLILRLGGVR